jgi:hypothetical protein
MRIVGIPALLLIASISVAHARSQATYHSTPVYRSAPVHHSAPVVRSYRSSPQPSVHYQSVPRSPVVHDSTIQHIPSGNGYGYAPSHFTTSRPFHAAPHIHREVARHLPWHGQLLAVPVPAALGAPVWLDIPDLGGINIDEQIYITEIYPLLISEIEADQERAYTRLKEVAEAQATQKSQEVKQDAAAPPSAHARGLAALNEGNLDAAIAEFTTAITDNPKDAFPYIRRGAAYEKKGDAASAIADYRKVLTLVDADIGAQYATRIRRLEKTKN